MGKKKLRPLGMKIEISFHNEHISTDKKALIIETDEEVTDDGITIKRLKYDVDNVIGKLTDAEFTASILIMVGQRLGLLLDEIHKNNQSEVH